MELTIEHLSKRYAQHWALRELSLRCEPGMLGLVGPNGAGKTTLMRMIATLLEPTEGSIRWNGLDIRTHGQALRQVLGYLPQEFGVYREFTGRQFLRYLAAMKGLPKSIANKRVDEVIEVVNLEQVADRKLPTYSGGMKQRVGIAQALLNDPELLIVDEPTAGLDPEERVRFRNLLSELSGARIVILSTHIVSDVEACATNIALIARGHLVTCAAPEELLRSVEGKVWERVVPSAELPVLRQQYLTGSTMHRSDGVHLRVVDQEAPGTEAISQPPTLEDAYLYWISGKKGETE